MHTTTLNSKPLPPPPLTRIHTLTPTDAATALCLVFREVGQGSEWKGKELVDFAALAKKAKVIIGGGGGGDGDDDDDDNNEKGESDDASGVFDADKASATPKSSTGKKRSGRWGLEEDGGEENDGDGGIGSDKDGGDGKVAASTDARSTVKRLRVAVKAIKRQEARGVDAKLTVTKMSSAFERFDDAG